MTVAQWALNAAQNANIIGIIISVIIYLWNTNNTASNLNSALNASIGNANTSKSSLDNSIGNAEQTILDLQQTNSVYTEHVNNMDIHVTKELKDKWNAYETKITELINIIDNYVYADACVVDDDNNNIVDDDSNAVIV